MKNELVEIVVTAMVPSGKGNLLFELQLPDRGNLPSFKAGAHIDIHLKNGMIRQYSLCGPASQTNAYQICVRLDKQSRGGSLSMHLDIAVGDTLQISHPRNHFTLPEADSYIMIAGGIGITPLISMAEDAFFLGRPFELHYYITNLEDVALLHRLQAEGLSGNCFIHESIAGDSLRNNIPASIEHPDARTAIITCGPSAFMQQVYQSAASFGWQSWQLHCEQFRNEVVTDNTTRQGFSVQVASTGQVFPVEDHQTIAEVLLSNGIQVELSCEQGMCGCCLTKVISGIPDHCDVVQTDAEKAMNHYITICCSRSMSDLLVLDL